MSNLSNQEFTVITDNIKEAQDALAYIVKYGISTGGEESYNALHLAQIEKNLSILLDWINKI